MNLQDLIRRFRVLSKDEIAPYFWSDLTVTDLLNDAQTEAATRGRLLLEDADPAVCAIQVTADTASYPLHPSLYELVRIAFKATSASESNALKLVTREWLDSRYWNWRDWGSLGHGGSNCRFVVQDEMRLRMVPPPGEDGQLRIEGYRIPLAPMALPDDKPEIHEASQVHLLQGALARAFSIPDSEAFDPERARRAEGAFTEHFGLPVDSDLRRSTRKDADQVNRTYLA